MRLSYDSGLLYYLFLGSALAKIYLNFEWDRFQPRLGSTIDADRDRHPAEVTPSGEMPPYFIAIDEAYQVVSRSCHKGHLIKVGSNE